MAAPHPFRHAKRTSTGQPLLVVLAAFLVGCGTTAPSLTEGSDLEGTWRMSSYETAAGELAGAALVLEIDLAAASVRGDSVCHTILGSLSVADTGSLSLTLPGTTTQPCDDDLQVLEDEIVAGLESVTSWERQGDQLTLLGPDQLRMEFQQNG